MTRVVLLAALASACAPGYSASTRKPAPLALHVIDMVAFSAGTIVGLSELNRPPYEERNDALMAAGFATAFASWIGYWFVSTGGSR